MWYLDTIFWCFHSILKLRPVKGIDDFGIVALPLHHSTEDSVNASEPETSAEKNLAGIQLWMISGVEKKAFYKHPNI